MQRLSAGRPLSPPSRSSPDWPHAAVTTDRQPTTSARRWSTTPPASTPPTRHRSPRRPSSTSALDAFVADPTDETLEAAKQAWLTARDDYGLTEAFRFYGGPIDNEETGPEGRINAWPLDEAYIDYVEGDEAAGIVNDTATYPTIDAELISLAERAGRRGQHLDRLARHRVPPVGPGPVRRRGRAPGRSPTTRRRRTPTAGRPTSSPRPTSCSPTSRRWSRRGRPTPTTTGRRSSSRSPSEALAAIITGIGELTRGELAGERMNVAYSERSQEDEHSCFSDNTTADLLANELGIRMVITGEYPGARRARADGAVRGG